MRKKPRQVLSVEELLEWSDAYYQRTGRWPSFRSGPIKENPSDSWLTINSALRAGIRGLPRCRGIAHLLEEHRGVRNRARPPALSVRLILKWADAHHRRTGKWPVGSSGPVQGAPGETWNAVELALTRGQRGLSGGSSLADLLARRRGRRHLRRLPRLTCKQILAWADEHHTRTGEWPRHCSGPVRHAPQTTWCAIDDSLASGTRGLAGGTTLARFLAKHRKVDATPRYRPASSLPPPLTIRQILAWADEHHKRTGAWPNSSSGRVKAAPRERWKRVNAALQRGSRGLPLGSSLARLLACHRKVRNPGALPRLSLRQILAWADAYHDLHEEWPQSTSGPIPEAPGETWAKINTALTEGMRGLPRRESLPQLLARCRRVRNRRNPGQLTIKQILSWLDEHRRSTGTWPISKGGPLENVPGESWNAINVALNQGLRGLTGGETLLTLRRRTGREW